MWNAEGERVKKRWRGEIEETESCGFIKFSMYEKARLRVLEGATHAAGEL